MTSTPSPERQPYLAGYLAICREFNIRRKHIAALVVLQAIGTVFEGVGLGIFVPILHLLSGAANPSAAASVDPVLRLVQSAFQWVGLDLTLEVLLLCAVLLLLLRQLFLFLRNVLQGFMQEKIKRDLRERLFERYVRVNLAYHDRDSSGAILNALTTEATMCAITVLQPILLVNTAIVGCVYFVLMVFVSPSMTLISAATLVVAGLLVYRVTRRTRDAGLAMTNANRGVSDFFVSRIQSLRLIRLVGNERAEISRTRQISREMFRIGYRIVVLSSSMSVLLEPIVVTSAVVILYVGVTFFGMSLAAIGFFVVILLRLLPTMRDISRLHQQYMAGYGTLRSLYARLMSMHAAREDRSGTSRFPTPLAQGIVFEGVDFDFPDSSARGAHTALRGIDLTIGAGKMTALVGPSGAGKSTLIDLLPRLRLPTRGRIVVDGTPLQQFELDSLRAAIAYVPQSPRIVEPTPAAHIRYGAAEITDDQVKVAATLAGAHDFIARLPRGYDTPLGEEGRLLSGGERQRLDLARALARRAPILILDEPTSNLDAESEYKLQDALKRLRQRGETTIIVIAHRLATVAQADNIVVLREGRVEASARHSRLVEISPWYARAFAHQAGALALEATARAGED